MIYRPYSPTDFASLYTIEEICFQPPLRFSRRYMRQLVGSHTSATWVAEDEDGMAGFAIVEWRTTRGISAYISTIEVTPKRRGSGAGRELLARLESSARDAGAGSIWLHVDPENTRAICLYESCGYTHMGIEEHFYAPGINAFVYYKKFQVGDNNEK